MASATRPAPYFDQEQVIRASKWLHDVKAFLEQYSEDDEASLDIELPVGDVIEVITLQYATKLVPNLLHFSDEVRINVILFFVELASVFCPDLEKVVKNFDVELQHVLHVDSDGDGHVEYEELFKAIHDLFSLIGKYFAPIVTGLVAGIQSYYYHSDPTVQETAISTASRLMYENSDIFSRKENLSVRISRARVYCVCTLALSCLDSSVYKCKFCL